MTEATALAVWERFTLKVVDASARLVALKSAHGLYLCAADAAGRLTADRPEASGWETWQLYLASADPSAVSLLSKAHGSRFVSRRGGARLATADVAFAGPAERFVLIDVAVAERLYGGKTPAAVPRPPLPPPLL